MFDVPGGAALNVELRRTIEQRGKTHPGTQHSDVAGWQSTRNIDRWGGLTALNPLALGRNVANRVTTEREGTADQGPHPGYFAVTWRGDMWANTNRSGHGNEFHWYRGHLRQAGHVLGLAEASHATLSRYGQTHLHRLQSHAMGAQEGGRPAGIATATRVLVGSERRRYRHRASN